ncbi:MAG: hypothetical protein A2762_05425, partial [Candidatus Lloydbacteria bacterium RIFCSPHIGHO2_01_FULL_54_11]
CFSSPEHRIKISAPEDIPEIFEHAIIAQEDQRFYEHNGVDVAGIVRAQISNMLSLRVVSGASTLEMQIAKNWLLKDTTKSYSRKIKEAILALKMDREFSKREILLMYVNMPYLERGQYGIEAGSRSYFGKPAKDLKVEEVAFIVSLISKPRLGRERGIDPATNERSDGLSRESVKRARHVLNRMDDLGYFDRRGGEVEYERAQAAISRLKFLAAVSGCSAEVVGPYYTEEIRRRHKDKLALNTGGLQIFLPVDPELSKVAEEALREGLTTYRSRHTLTDERIAELAGKAGVSPEEWKKTQEADRESIRGLAFGVDFAGRVRFMIGGEDFAKSKWNVATQGFRQPGSTFKAFTYAALNETLLEELIASGVSEDDLLKELDKRCVVVDGPVAVSRGRGRAPKWIQNFRTNSQPMYRGQISCRTAIAESRNTAAVRAGQRAGVRHMVEVAGRLGLGTGDRKYEIQPYPTTAIGASDVAPIDMSAYLSFVNGGYKIPRIWEYDICKKDKQKVLRSVLANESPDPLDPSVVTPRECTTSGVLPASYERVLHPVVAEHMKRLLQAPVDESTGTAHSLRTGVVIGADPLKWDPKAPRIKFPFEEAGEIAAKTGTATNDNGDTSDVWFIVLIPGVQGKPETGMVMVFWMGKTTKSSLGPRETGGRNLVPVAAKIMRFLKEKRGLLQPGNKFEPIIPLSDIPTVRTPEGIPGASPSEESEVIDPSNPFVDPEKLKLLPPLDLSPTPPSKIFKEDGPDVPD